MIQIDESGNSVRKTTSVDQGDESPEWNQWIHFGTDTWKQFKVKVYDSDLNSDDSLSSQQTWYLSSLTSRTFVRHNCHSGYVYFDYYFN